MQSNRKRIVRIGSCVRSLVDCVRHHRGGKAGGPVPGRLSLVAACEVRRKWTRAQVVRDRGREDLSVLRESAGSRWISRGEILRMVRYIVRETLRAVAGEGDSKGILNEGERSALDVMVKDDRLYQETGGWGFETFDSKNARLAEKGRAQCYACHSKQKDHDLVFTHPPRGRHGHAVSRGVSAVDFPPQLDGSGDLRCVREEALRKAVHGGNISFLCERQGHGGLAHGLVSRWSDHCRRDAGVAFRCGTAARRKGSAA